MTQSHEDGPLVDLPSEIVYVRAVTEDERASLPANAPPGGALYAIHDQAGARLALTDNRDLAFKVARQHDRMPVSVH